MIPLLFSLRFRSFNWGAGQLRSGSHFSELQKSARSHGLWGGTTFTAFRMVIQTFGLITDSTLLSAFLPFVDLTHFCLRMVC